MNFSEGRYQVLAGEPPVPDHGVWATVSAEIASGLNDGSEQEAFTRSGAVAFLSAPAAAVALYRMPGRRKARHYVIAITLVTALVVTLLFAGTLVPG